MKIAVFFQQLQKVALKIRQFSRALHANCLKFFGVCVTAKNKQKITAISSQITTLTSGGKIKLDPSLYCMKF